MWDLDSDVEYDSEASNGEPYFTLKEEVRRGDYYAIKMALDSGRDPNDRDRDHGDYTLRHWAAGMTDEDNLRWMNAQSYSSMMTRRGVVALLIERGAIAWRIWWRQEFWGNHTGQRVWELTDDKPTIRRLKKACIEQVLTMIRDDNTKACIEALNSGLIASASLNLTVEMAEIFKAGADVDDDACDVTALSEAAAAGSLDAVKILVEDCNAKVNYDNDTAFWKACTAGRNEVVQYLLQHNANPFADKGEGPVTVWSKGFEVRNTVLFHATEKIEEQEVISERLANYAYHMFITSGHIHGIYALLNAGKSPPPNALQTAVSFGQVEALELLLAEGAMKTYDEKVKRDWYGRGVDRPRDSVVAICQQRLDETIAAALEFHQLQI